MTRFEAKLVVLHDLTGGPVTIEIVGQITRPNEWHVYAGPPIGDRHHASAHRLERAVDELVDKLNGAPLVDEALTRANLREQALAKAPAREVD